MNNRLVRSLKYFLGWPISLIALFFIFKIIGEKSIAVLPQITSLNYISLSYGIFFLIMFFFIRSIVWNKLLESQGIKLSLKESSYMWGMSELKRYTPGNIWSFIARTLSFSEKGIDKKIIGKSILIEIELFVISSLIVSLLSLSFIFNSFLSLNNDLYIFLPYLITAILSLFFIFKQKFSYYKNALFLSLYVLSFVSFGLGTYFTADSIFTLDPRQIVVLSSFFVFSWLIGYLSFITPMGLGVREGVMTLGLSKILSLSVSGIISIFSRLILIISELLFILFITIWNRKKSKVIDHIESIVKKYKHELLLSLFVLFYFHYFTLASFLRHQKFFTGRFDLGNMDQVVFNTINGRFFLFTDPNSTNLVSRLSYHADFILAIISPLYLIWSDPRTLLILQTIILSLGSAFVFLIARKILNNKVLALLLSFSYLINPAVAYTNLYDFHPVTLATTFLLASFYFVLKRKYLLFTIFAILAAFCKEQVWLITGLFGLLIFLRESRGKKRLFAKIFGLLFFVVSVGVFYYLVWYAIPSLRGGDHFALSYYSDFGDSPSEIIRNIIFSPSQALSLIFEKSRLMYLNILFFPLGFLSFASPLFLILALPDFTISLLSNNPQLRQIYYQYSATITPFIFISAIYGIAFLRRKIKKITFFIAFYLGIMSILSFYLYSPFPGARHANIDMFTQSVPNEKIINDSLRKIPQSASVAASNNLGSHLSQRENIYTIPVGTQSADFVVFLLNDWYAQPSLPAQKEMAQQFERDPKYKTIIKDGLFVLFEKTSLK